MSPQQGLIWGVWPIEQHYQTEFLGWVKMSCAKTGGPILTSYTSLPVSA